MPKHIPWQLPQLERRHSEIYDNHHYQQHNTDTNDQPHHLNRQTHQYERQDTNMYVQFIEAQDRMANIWCKQGTIDRYMTDL